MRFATGFLLLGFVGGCLNAWPFARQASVPVEPAPTAVACALVGKPAPETRGEDLDGVPFQLSDYRGKVVVLDFWGHW